MPTVDDRDSSPFLGFIVAGLASLPFWIVVVVMILGMKR